MPSVYKIRHVATGTFSTGGTFPSFTKKGKVWNNKSALSNHLKLVDPSRYVGCEVVEVEVVHREVGTISLADLLAAKKAALAKKEATQKERARAATERAEREQLARLQAKYQKP